MALEKAFHTYSKAIFVRENCSETAQTLRLLRFFHYVDENPLALIEFAI